MAIDSEPDLSIIDTFEKTIFEKPYLESNLNFKQNISTTNTCPSIPDLLNSVYFNTRQLPSTLPVPPKRTKSYLYSSTVAYSLNRLNDFYDEGNLITVVS